MGADGHVYIFFVPDSWLFDFVSTICTTTIPDDVIDYVEQWDAILTFYDNNPDGCYAYWDTEYYDIVNNEDLTSLTPVTMEHVRQQYRQIFRCELDETAKIRTWIHEFLRYSCDVNQQIWT